MNYLPSWQYPSTNQSFHHCIADSESSRRPLQCHASGTPVAQLDAVRVPKTIYPGHPPTVALTRGKSQTVQHGRDGLVVAPLGQLPHQFDQRSVRHPSMHAAGIARHAQLGVHSPGPVDLQKVFGRRLWRRDHDLLNHRAQQSLLELDGRLGLFPQSLQIPAQLL